MGRMSREKGAREERIIIEWFKSIGLDVRRTAASGAMQGHSGDFELNLLGQTFTGEGKARASGFRSIYKWLEGHAFLTCRANGQKPIVVCTQWFWEHIITLLLQQNTELQALLASEATQEDKDTLAKILGEEDDGTAD